MCYNKNKNRRYGYGAETVSRRCNLHVLCLRGDPPAAAADGAHQLLRIDIEEIISVRQIQYVGIEATVFLCRATVRDKKWLFELKYTIRTHCWCLMRKVY